MEPECEGTPWVQQLWHWMSVGIEGLSNERQQVCCWWGHKSCAQRVSVCRACSCNHTNPGVYFSVCGHLSSHWPAQIPQLPEIMAVEQAPVSDGRNASRELSLRAADSVELQLHQAEAAVPADTRHPSSAPLLLLGMKHLKACVTPKINPHSFKRSQWWSPAQSQPWQCVLLFP